MQLYVCDNRFIPVLIQNFSNEGISSIFQRMRNTRWSAVKEDAGVSLLDVQLLLTRYMNAKSWMIKIIFVLYCHLSKSKKAEEKLVLFAFQMMNI